MRNLKTYESWVTEINIPTNKWVDWDLSRIDQEGIDLIWKMYSDTYGRAGMDFSADDSAELKTKYKASYLKDIDKDHKPDAFIIYKETPYGKKIALLGTNGKKAARVDIIKQVISLLNKKGWFIEASLRMEELLAKSPVPVITDWNAIENIVGKDKKPIEGDDGYYTRKLSKANKRIEKRMYGKLSK